MRKPTVKFSVSLPKDLATAVHRHVGARGLSGFVARAIAHELERERPQELVGELDELHEEVPAELAHPKRASTLKQIEEAWNAQARRTTTNEVEAWIAEYSRSPLRNEP